MKIYLGSDHAGFSLKQKVKAFLDKKKILYEDLGNYKYNKNDDYPDFVFPVARKVAKNKQSLGIVFGGSGQGEAIAANKIKGIRAVVYYGGSFKIIKLSKKHNNSNILSLGARFINEKEAIKAVKIWLKTKFSEKAHHKRRLIKIDKLGSK